MEQLDEVETHLPSQLVNFRMADVEDPTAVGHVSVVSVGTVVTGEDLGGISTQDLKETVR